MLAGLLARFPDARGRGVWHVVESIGVAELELSCHLPVEGVDRIVRPFDGTDDTRPLCGTCYEALAEHAAMVNAALELLADRAGGTRPASPPAGRITPGRRSSSPQRRQGGSTAPGS